MTIEELNQRMSLAAAQVKLSAGVCNNATWEAVREAHDHIKKHVNYKHRVKMLYKRALDEFHAYEHQLVHAQKNRMFHIADMSDKVRKIYGNISDREYYDFWAGTGSTAYAQTRPLVTSLCNKYRLSLMSHGINQAELTAWAMTAQACLELAVQVLDTAIEVVCDTHKIPRRIADEVFGQFSLRRVADTLMSALRGTDTDVDGIQMSSLEERNIAQGLEQLQDAWGDTIEHLDIVSATMKDYDDVFRTKGEMKKAWREIAELSQELRKEERENERQRINDKYHIASVTDGGGRRGSDVPCASEVDK